MHNLLKAIGNISLSAADTVRTTAREIDRICGVGARSSSVRSLKKSADSHPSEKSKGPVATPMPDRTVSLKTESSLLSPDFDQQRAMTDAKFNAFQKGMDQMKEKKS